MVTADLTGDQNHTSLMVRAISAEDAPAVAELTGQLGYEASLEATRERIRALASSTEIRAAFVACLGGEIVGWIEVSIAHPLQSSPYALIGGLVVRESVRGRGVGKVLCAHAEAWSRTRGVAILRVRSRTSREGAHRFYIREGFRQIKTSVVFDKLL